MFLRSTSLLRMRCSSRSSGPSNWGTLIGYGWMNSAPGGTGMRMPSAIRDAPSQQLHRVRDPLHRLAREPPGLAVSLFQDLLGPAGPGLQLRSFLPDRLERGVHVPDQVLLAVHASASRG